MKIKLAGLVIDIGDPGEYTKKICCDYIVADKEAADIKIELGAGLMEKEKNKYPDSPADYLENICIYRQICMKIADFGGALIHSAAVAVDGFGYLFTALSGTGKTTHMNLWLDKFKKRAVVVNGDKPIVREKDGEFYVYGTPWCGKEGYNSNIGVPVKGICILKRSAENNIERISEPEALAWLMGQTVYPEGREGRIALLAVLEKITANVPVYRLYCNMEPDAANEAYNGMSKK